MDALLDVHLHQPSYVLSERLKLGSLLVYKTIGEKPTRVTTLLPQEGPLLPIELLALNIQSFAKVTKLALTEVDFVKVRVKVLSQELPFGKTACHLEKALKLGWLSVFVAFVQ